MKSQHMAYRNIDGKMHAMKMHHDYLYAMMATALHLNVVNPLGSLCIIHPEDSTRYLRPLDDMKDTMYVVQTLSLSVVSKPVNRTIVTSPCGEVVECTGLGDGQDFRTAVSYCAALVGEKNQ